MKKTLLFVVAVALLYSCSSPEKKAQKLIKEHLKTSLLDSKSYEALKFSSLDSSFTKLEENIDYKKYNIRFDIYITEVENLTSEIKMKLDMPYTYSNYIKNGEYDLNKKFRDEYLDSATFYNEKIEYMINNFKSEFCGWQMNHDYKAMAREGNKMIYSQKFFFDKDLSHIKKTIDL